MAARTGGAGYTVKTAITLDTKPAERSLNNLKETLNTLITQQNKAVEKMNSISDKSSDDYKKAEAEYNRVGKQIKEQERMVTSYEQGIKRIKNAMGDLNGMNLKELRASASEIRKQLSNLTLSDEDVKKGMELKALLGDVNAQMDKLNEKWGMQNNAQEVSISNLKEMVVAYLSIEKAWEVLTDVWSKNIELSDSLSSIQKTTGMTAEEVRILTGEIDKIDTRASQEQLYNLAATAGQLGLSAQEDVLGFVKASTQLTVALDELGDDGVETLVKLNQLTGETDRMGLEKALVATGSAINELSAASAASAGPISDVMSRLSGVAAQANMATADIAALAATTDALGQSSEVSGTALSTFITKIVSDTDKVAKAVGLSSSALKDMINSGDTTGAVVQVLEQLNKMGSLDKIAPVMGDLGGSGARMIQVLSTLGSNVDMLKKQIDISRSAFQEATSVTNEYNTVNENAAALVERMGNAIREKFVNSTFVEWIRQVLLFVMQLPEKIDQWAIAIGGVTAAMTANAAATAASAAGMTVYELATYNAGKAVGFLKVGLLNLWKVMLNNPFTVVAAGAAILAQKIYNTLEAQRQLVDYQEALNTASKTYTSSLNSEKKSIDGLFEALKNAKKGTQEYDNAKQEILKNYGGYLKGLGSEIESLNNVDQAYRNIIASATKAAKARAITAGMNTADDKYLNDTGAMYEKMYDYLVKYGYAQERAMNMVEQVRSSMETGNALSADLQKWVDSFNSVQSRTSGQGYTQTIQVNEIASMVNSIRTSGNARQQAYDNLEKRFGKLSDNQVNNPKTGDNTPTETVDPVETDKQRKKRLAEEAKENNARKKQLKEELETYLRELNAYYDKRKEIILQQQNDGDILEAQSTRMQEANDKERYDARIRLMRSYLGMAEGLQQEQMDVFNKYMESTGADNIQLFSNDKIQEMGKQLGEDYAKSLAAGIGESMQKDAISLQKIDIAANKRMRKILENDNDFTKLISGFRNDLDELNLFITDYSEITGKNLQDVVSKHIGVLIDASLKANTMTIEGLRTMLENNGMGELVSSVGEQGMQRLMVMLRNFRDSYQEVINKTVSNTKKLFDAQWKASGKVEQQKNVENAYVQSENSGKERKQAASMLDSIMGESIDSMGMSLTDHIDLELEAQQLELLKEKLAYQQEYVTALADEYDQKIANARTTGNDEEADELELAKLQAMKDANEGILDMKQQVFDKESELNEKSLEMANNQIAMMQPYKDALSTFGESFGEALFGSKEDRQNAAKDLLKTVAQTTLNLLKERLMYLVKSQLLDKQEIVQKQVTNATMNAIDKASAAEEIGTEAAVATGEVTIEQAKSTAKAFGKSFWIGLAVSAAISAAFAGLMGMINGALSSTSSSLGTSSTSSNKRMSTGMLTYAEGKYPVLGNDGKTYDAKYQSKLETGIYNGPHFGIFSEKKPEAVIDGDTTQRLVMNYPAIWDAIKTISKNGRLVNGGAGVMATHAAGTLDAVQAKYAAANAGAEGGSVEGVGGNNDTNAMLLAAITALNAQLAQGISAKMNMYGPDGLREQLKTADRFAKRTGL